MPVLLVLLLVGLAFGIWHAALIAWIVLAWTVLTSDLPAWVLAHYWLAVGYVAGYFAVGACWSVVKWWFEETAKVRRLKERYQGETLAKMMKDSKTDLTYHDYQDIYFWIAFWPFSMTWTLIDDPLRRIAERIADELRGVYQRITDRVWQP